MDEKPHDHWLYGPAEWPEKPKRPWYSFRRMILFWILLPFVWISSCDYIAGWHLQQAHEAREHQGPAVLP
jgi:hypothetical protein